MKTLVGRGQGYMFFYEDISRERAGYMFFYEDISRERAGVYVLL